MLYVFSAHVKPEQLRAYRDWLHENRKEIEENSPDGWNLRGVYFTVFGLGEHVSEIHWDLREYASFDVAVAQCRDTRFARVLEEWFGFLDLSNTRGRVLKDVYDEGTVVVAR